MEMEEVMSEKSERKSEGFWERVEKIAKEVDSWPEWKRNLGGLGSNYCSELQPCRGEYDLNKERGKSD